MSRSEVAIVTGAGSGIGRATAELFASRGYRVVVNDLSPESLKWVDASPDARSFLALPGDVSAADHNAALVEAAVKHFGGLSVSVLNAGMVGTLPWEDPGAVEKFERIMAVNVTGVVHGIRHAAEVMKKNASGVILATASTSGLRGDPGNYAYNASKAAVFNLVRAAAVDLGVYGIRVNGVAPGPVETGITERLKGLPGAMEEMAKRIPLRRWGQPHELAEAFFFLASPAASFITGTTLMVDGGHSAHAAHFDLRDKA